MKRRKCAGDTEGVQHRAQVESDRRADESRGSRVKPDGAQVGATGYFLDSTRTINRSAADVMVEWTLFQGGNIFKQN